MIIQRCPFCYAFLPATASIPVHYSSDGPWLATYQLHTHTCPSCRTPIRVQTSSFEPDAPVIWNGWTENMLEGTDYFHLSGSDFPRPPQVACWVWTPMAADTTWVDRTITAIMQDDYLRPMNRILVLPPNIPLALWNRAESFFASIWRLASHVMAGGVGPYPSLRAERSLIQTLSVLGGMPIPILHYWPAGALGQLGYRPLGDVHELRAAWSLHARRDIMLTVRK